MINTLKISALAVVALLAGVEPARADVRLTMHDGLVTLVARDATVRQILAEWATVGQVTIVNAERIVGGPVTLEFADVPEKQALDILLRSVSGYLAAPRPSVVSNASRFDRIVVLPGTAQPRLASSTSAPLPQPQSRLFELPTLPPEFELTPLNAPNPDDPGQPAVNRPHPPAPPPAAAQRPATTFAAPTGPGGVAAPGLIVQPQLPPDQTEPPVRF